MKTKFYSAIIIALLFAVADLNAQTNTFPTTGAAGIGTTSPNASSLLEIKSTTGTRVTVRIKRKPATLLI